MNGRRAKELRRKIYGDGSKRNEYSYKYESKTVEREVISPKDGLPVMKKFKVMVGGFYCVGKRAEYQALKKARPYVVVRA